MTEETIFETALHKASPAERSAYLAEACGGDAALRQRVEALLAAHQDAGDFLDRPAAEQVAAGMREPGGHPTQAATEADAGDDDREALPFLAPPGRPGSLGRLSHYEVTGVI